MRLIAALLKAASAMRLQMTEQTDAWVIFDLAAADLAPVWNGCATSIFARCTTDMPRGR